MTPAQRTWDRVEIAGCPIDLISMEMLVELIEQTIRDRRHLSHGVVDAAQLAKMRNDSRLTEHVLSNDIINADGQTVVWLSKLYRKSIPERITGIDLFQRLVRHAAEHDRSVFLLGASPQSIERVAAAVRDASSRPVLAGYRAGYFTLDEEPQIVEEIVASGADMLFTGLPTPLEERFLFEHRERLRTVPFVTGLGGGFEFVAGDVRRAPGWMQRAGLEWLHRFAQEPRRKFKTEVVDAASFYAGLAKDRLRGRRR